MTDCIIYKGHKNPKGYGVIKLYNKRVLVHRLIFKINNSSVVLKKGLCVCHKCDNPPCINPDHLFLGTYADNNKDRILKSRGAKGEGHGRAKLSELDVLRIRSLAINGLLTYAQLGIKFNVDRALIRRIVERKLWSHI